MTQLTHRLRRFWPLLVLLGLTLFLHRRLALTNLVIGRGDSYLYFYPYWHAAAEALRVGRLPLWNPDLFMGAPLLANSQVGFFYPLNWPLWLLLPTPYAVSASIVLHVWIGACGGYALARRALRLSHGGAILAGALYALGGYFTAQVEHVNQAQGLAWLPWLLTAATDLPLWPAWRPLLRRAAVLGGLFGLMLLAGHTQTTFISGVAVVLWIGVQALAARPTAGSRLAAIAMRAATGAGTLAVGVALAVLLAAVQLLPTLELTGLSRRQGGLPIEEALSFSLHPLLFARALLPGYGQIPYAEYIAGLPVLALVLGWMGAVRLRRGRLIGAALTLALVGLLLALGEFNPLYRDWVVHLPGFDLFRAPARWLTLYALGAALLAGAGWDALTERPLSLGAQRGAALGAAVALLLMMLAVLSMHWGQTRIPMPPESPAEPLRHTLWVGWLAELFVALTIAAVGLGRLRWTRYAATAVLLWGMAVVIQTMQAQALTTPEAYFDVRQSIARLQTAAAAERAAGQPVGRFLSMSKGYFDPGDQGEIDSIYADQLDDAARYTYTVAVKDKEIVVPNLPLVYGLSAVDGFDGGLLPLYAYAATAGLMLPPGVETIDGRLRIWLEAVPDDRWLDLFGVRWLITDKIGDQWFAYEDANVFFDLQMRVTLQPGESVQVGALPPLESTEVWIIAEGTPGQVRVGAGPTEDVWPVEQLTDVLGRAVWSQPGVPDRLTLTAIDGPWTIAGLALVDNRSNAFRQIVPGAYRLAHSGDVKVYENLDVLPRAFLVTGWEYAADVDAAVARMADPAFDPAVTAIVTGAGEAQATRPGAQLAAAVTAYTAERIAISAQTDGDALLVIADAAYPGWQATVNGAPAPIATVNGMFRGVFLPAGSHTVELTFHQGGLRTGAASSALGAAVLLGIGLWTWRDRRAETAQERAAAGKSAAW